MQLNLFVIDKATKVKIPAVVTPATEEDFAKTLSDAWQTDWNSKAAKTFPNKVALRRRDNDELLGLMSYEIHSKSMVVEIVYIESAAHSNANLLRQTGKYKKYQNIARALIAYAVKVSLENGCDGVVTFQAKTTELYIYYMKEFGAAPLPPRGEYRMIIWDDVAADLIRIYQKEG